MNNDNLPIINAENYYGPKVSFKFSMKSPQTAPQDSIIGMALESYNPFNADEAQKCEFMFIKSAMSHWKTALHRYNSSGIIIPDLQINTDHIIIGEHKIYDNDILTFDGLGKIVRGEIKDSSSEFNKQDSDNYSKNVNYNTKTKIGGVISSPERLITAYKSGAQLNALYRVEDMFLGKGQYLLRSYLIEKDTRALENIYNYISNDFHNYFSTLESIPAPFETYVRLLDIPLRDWAENDLLEIKKIYGDKIFNTRGEPIGGAPLAMMERKLYQTQAEAILNAASLCRNVNPVYIGLSNVTNSEQVLLLDDIVTKEKFKIRNQARFLTRIYVHDETTDLSLEREASKIAHMVFAISIGASDITADVTGISRYDHTKINEYQKKNGLNYNIYTKLDPEVEKVILQRTEAWKGFNSDLRLICCSSHVIESMPAFYNMNYDILGVLPERIPEAAEKLFKLSKMSP